MATPSTDTQVMTTSQAVIFGEVLFDCFPEGRTILGGAPFNVAWNLQMLGVQPLFIGAVGQDDLGEQVLAAMQRIGLKTHGLQRHSERPTGQVQVSFQDGEPHYQILPDRAYDAIDPHAIPQEPFDLLYHGSLALRTPHNQAVFSDLRQRACRRFVDVNLRHPWYTPTNILQLIQGADYVKLNHAEFAELLSVLWPATQLDPDDATTARDFLQQTNIGQALIITQGAQGAHIITRSGDVLQAPAAPVSDFQDAVGAGDAFASRVLLGILHDQPWPQTLEAALEFAARVCALRGATSTDPAFYR